MSGWNGTDQEAKEIFHKIIVQEHEKLIHCAIAYLRLKTTETYLISKAEDIVQEMYELAWKKRAEVLSKDKPVGWLYEALYYKVKELLREENKWEKRLLKYQELYVQPVQPHINLSFELDGIVPKEDFDLLHKIYVAGYSYRELCQEMNLTKPTLAAKVHRIKERIRKELKE